jgi:hypothetical protein
MLQPTHLFSCQTKTTAVVSGDAAAAKEAEANASGNAQQPTVAYIKVPVPICFSPLRVLA